VDAMPFTANIEGHKNAESAMNKLYLQPFLKTNEN